MTIPVKATWSVAVIIGSTLLSHTLARAVAIAPSLKALVSPLSSVHYQLVVDLVLWSGLPTLKSHHSSLDRTQDLRIGKL